MLSYMLLKRWTENSFRVGTNTPTTRLKPLPQWVTDNPHYRKLSDTRVPEIRYMHYTHPLAVTTIAAPNGEPNPKFKPAFPLWAGNQTNPVTFFPGQQVGAGVAIEDVIAACKPAAPDGIELCDWGGVFDSQKALADGGYTKDRVKFFKQHGLDIFALSAHLGTCLINQFPITQSFYGFVGMVAPHIACSGRRLSDADSILVQKAAVKYAKGLAVAAGQIANEVGHPVVVNGFSGSEVWHLVHNFPGAMEEVDAAFTEAGKVWEGEILPDYQQNGTAFAIEVHPGCMAFDPYSTVRLFEAVNYHPHFGVNHDPSHGEWMGVDAAAAALFYGDRIFHFHAKDTKRNKHPLAGIAGGHLNFDDSRRGWTFEVCGFGDVNFRSVGRGLTQIGYKGPVSSEQESSIIDWSLGHRACIELARRELVLPAVGIRFDKFAK